jgi:hypothetical protein
MCLNYFKKSCNYLESVPFGHFHSVMRKTLPSRSQVLESCNKYLISLNIQQTSIKVSYVNEINVAYYEYIFK